MRRTRRESVDFPANPFVALADFTLMTVVVVTLGFVSLSVFSKELMENVAITSLQNHLVERLKGTLPSDAASPELVSASRANKIAKTWTDGNLQRFSFDGMTLYAVGTGTESVTRLTPEGRRLLIAFGKLLHAYEGDPDHPGTGLFKRISVQGNCDPSEGQGTNGVPDDDHLWTISQARAREAAEILQQECGINHELIEATGRGSWDKSPRLGGTYPKGDPRRSLQNRRLDIVIYYSGERAIDFMAKSANKL